MGPEVFIWYLVFVFSTTCHEAAHAWVAHRGGDSTAYRFGHASLDPIPHIRRSPVGMVLVPLISYFQMGWMIGWASVPFDADWGRRFPRRQAMMSLAGPTANLLVALAAFVTLRILVSAEVLDAPARIGASAIEQIAVAAPGTESSLMGALAMGLSILLYLNVLLGLFNLLPVPPLDGGGIVEGFARGRLLQLYGQLRESPWMQMLALLVAWQLFARITGPLFWLLMALVHPGVRYG